MTRAKKRKRQQGCDVAKMIDTIEKAASTAMKMDKAVDCLRRYLCNGAIAGL